MLPTDIIQQLNECDGRSMGFPHFGVFFPVDVRLSAYRDIGYWALFIETLVFNDGPSHHDCFVTHQFCYGNNLPQAIGHCGRLNVTRDAPSGPLFDPDDVMGHYIRASAKDMRIRDKVVPITTNREIYESAGVRMETPRQWVNCGIERHRQPAIHGCELLRLIAPIHRRLLFATEAEIVERIGNELPLLLRLGEWRHPSRDEGEAPADSESFQMIAETIAHNDPSLYHPTVPPNTHWSNWPMAGTI